MHRTLTEKASMRRSMIFAFANAGAYPRHRAFRQLVVSKFRL
jgi:hypothetical protein